MWVRLDIVQISYRYRTDIVRISRNPCLAPLAHALALRVNNRVHHSDDLTVNAMILRSRSDSGSSNTANIRGVDGETYYRTVIANGSLLASTDQTDDNDTYNITVNYDLGFATLTSSSSHLDIKSYQFSNSALVGQDSALNSGVLSLGIINESKGFCTGSSPSQCG